jgi:hypothetical protein
MFLIKSQRIRVARWHIFEPKIPIWKIWKGLALEDVGILYVRLVYCTAIWHILWPFGTLYFYLVYFSRVGMLYQEKSGNPATNLN